MMISYCIKLKVVMDLLGDGVFLCLFYIDFDIKVFMIIINN